MKSHAVYGLGLSIVISFSTSSLLQAKEQEPIIVTATRTAQTVDESLASVTVITREEIETSQAKSLDEILRNVAGIDVSRNGGYGKTTNVFMRGTESDHILVLIDGVRASSATLGTFAWSQYSPDQIERIEIVRGPRSSLYGSDAIGGVIQIFTRQAKDTRIKLSAGSHRTRGVSVSTGGGKDWLYSVEAGYLDTDGIPSNVLIADDHGFSQSHAVFNLTGNLNPANQLKFNFTHNDGKNELDSDTGDMEFTNQIASLKLDHTSSAFWSQTYLLGYTLDDSTSYSPSTPANITTKRYSGTWQNDLSWQTGITSIGLDFWQDNAVKDNSGTVDKTIENKALFLQHQASHAKNNWLVAARLDDHSNFGSHETWNLSWGRQYKNTQYSISYGTAFKAPTINDLHWPYSISTYLGTTFITRGNPNLQPEESKTVEFGIQHRFNALNKLEIAIYESRLDNLIEWQSTQTGPTEYSYQPQNITKATILGLEVTNTVRLQKWLFTGSVTILDAKNDITGIQLDRRPREKLTIKATYQDAEDQFYTEFIAASKRKDANGTEDLDGYNIFNVSYQRNIGKLAQAQLRVENLFDTDYVLATSFSRDYSTLGRSLYIDFIYKLH